MNLISSLTRPLNVVRIAFACILVMIACALLLHPFFSGGNADSEDFFSSALRAHDIRESVSIAGVRYDISAGEVSAPSASSTDRTRANDALRLAYAKTLAKRDPLLSIAGTNPDSFKASVEKLVEIREEMLPLQKNSDEARLIKTSLYPIDFLMALAAAEKARLRFIASGSDGDRREYDASVDTALDAYERDLARYRSAFLHAVPDSIRSFSVADVVIDKTETLRALDALRERGADARAKFNERHSCTAGITSACNSDELSFPRLPAAADRPKLSASDVTFAEKMRGLIFDARGLPHSYGNEPFIYLERSSCVPNHIPLFFAVSVPSVAHGHSIVRPFPVSDFRFVRVSEFPRVPFFAYFAALGMEYVPSSQLLHYSCPSVGDDFSHIFATRITAGLARDHAASRTAPEQDELATLEEAFEPSHKVVTEHDAIRYANAAQSAAKRSSSSELSDVAASLSLPLARRTAGLQDVIDMMTEIEHQNITEKEARGLPVDLSAETYFYYRSGFLSLFLAHNETISTIPVSVFPAVGNKNRTSPFIYFSEVKDQAQIYPKLLADLKQYIALHLGTP